VKADQRTTHDRLRVEAATLFARRGYSGASMAEIAQRVGIRKASLYNYYDSKAELMVELLERSLSDWDRACQLAIDPDATVRDRLVAYLRSALLFARENPEAVGIIRLAAGQMPRELRQRVHRILDRYEEGWRETSIALFEEAIAEGEVEAADPAALARFWGIFVDGLLISQVFELKGAGEVEEHLPHLARMFWRGVGGSDAAQEGDR
jgi:AcrR family transcriptional regulator